MPDLRPLAVPAVLLIVAAGVGAVRWARRHSSGAQFAAGLMLLVIGLLQIPIVHPPQQGIEEARKDKGTKGAQSGDPPDDLGSIQA